MDKIKTNMGPKVAAVFALLPVHIVGVFRIFSESEGAPRVSRDQWQGQK